LQGEIVVTYAIRVYVAVVIGLALLGVAQGRGRMVPHSSNGCVGTQAAP
jgi:hypothetical protein